MSELNKLSHEIIGCAMAVMNELKPGLDEKLYENALKIELEEKGHQVEQQARHKVVYKGREIGTLVPDMIVNETIIVDPKVVTAFNEHHVAQMLGYLNITSLPLALLLNFKYSDLRIKRVKR